VLVLLRQGTGRDRLGDRISSPEHGAIPEAKGRGAITILH
jgi:hypothetical protein